MPLVSEMTCEQDFKRTITPKGQILSLCDYIIVSDAKMVKVFHYFQSFISTAFHRENKYLGNFYNF